RTVLLAMLKAADLAVLAACLLAATGVALHTTGGADTAVLGMPIQLADVLLVLAYLSLCHVVLTTRGLYESYRLSAPGRLRRDLIVAVAICTALLVPAALMMVGVARAVIGLSAFAVASVVALAGVRHIGYAVSRQLRRRGRNLRNAIIVGTGDAALEL